jgi:hypothetical protein
LAAQQRLETNATTSRIVGVACLVLGVISLCGLGNLINFSAPAMVVAIYVGAIVLVFFGPGALYLVFASHIRRGRQWAIITTLVVASLHALLMFASLVVNVLAFNVPAVLVGGILFLLQVLLIVHCARGLAVAREVGAMPHGFEPLMPPNPGMWQAPAQPPPAEGDGGWPDIR